MRAEQGGRKTFITCFYFDHAKRPVVDNRQEINLILFFVSKVVKRHRAAGAVASVCVHELGHALYLESIGKSWKFKASAPSGFAVHTADNLTDDELSNLGRAGFALQTLIGTGLTLFEETRHSDFTKGCVGMNAA